MNLMDSVIPTTTGQDSSAAEQLASLIRAGFGPEDIVELRLIAGDGAVKSNFYTASDLVKSCKTITASLASDNEEGWNIYFGANPRNAKGRRGDENVAIARWVFADVDGSTALEEMMMRVESAALPTPSIVILSGRGIHLYWLLDDPCTDMAAWSELMKDIAAAIGGDPVIYNPERVMRAPGFTNYKKGKTTVHSRFIECHPDRRYLFADLRDITPQRPTTAAPPPPPPVYRDCSHIDDNQKFKRCMAYVAKLPPSISGEHGSNAMLRVACETRRFGLSTIDALHVMRTYSSTRSIPPWSEKEILHKLKAAEKKVTGEAVGKRLRDDRAAFRAGRIERLRARIHDGEEIKSAFQ